MRVIIGGAGQVGHSLAEYLSAEGSHVTVIDKNEDTINQIVNELDVNGVVGYASDPAILQKAGAKDTDMIIAVTREDEVNMIACQVAHSLFNVQTKIARIRNLSYLDPIWGDLYSRDHLPVDVIISPEIEVAKEIAHRIMVPGAYDVIPLVNQMLGVNSVFCKEDCPIQNTALYQIPMTFQDLHFEVILIFRDGEPFIPQKDDQIIVGDEIYFIADMSQIRRVMAVFGYEYEDMKKVVIFGGGNVGLFLAQEIEERYPKMSIELIEYSQKRAEKIAGELSKTIVLNGDALDPKIMEEANIHNAGAIVSVTNDDEINILSSLLAKQNGAKRVLTLVSKSNYSKLLMGLGIDAAINPRNITVSRVLRHLRQGKIQSVHSLKDGLAEVFEAIMPERSSLINLHLKDIKLSEGVRICALVRDNVILMPSDNPVLKPNDTMIALAMKDQVHQVEEMFLEEYNFFEVS